MNQITPTLITPHANGNSTVTAQIISLSEMHPPANAATASAVPPANPNGLNPFHHVKATLKVCVGAAVITVGELVNAKVDQVICLDSRVNDPVDLLIEGKVVARGQLVAVDDRFGVRITQLPQALEV
jgi:flagellar motor switch protein FliN/FliY